VAQICIFLYHARKGLDMRVVIKKDYATVSAFVASHVADRINAFGPTEERPFVLGLPTGSSPIGTYGELVRLYKEGKVSFKNVITFNMDEYVGLGPDDPKSYYYFMHEHLLNHIDIKKENIHILDGLAKDLYMECDDYEDKIHRCGQIQLQLGGIGSNGHIAFCEPGSSLTSRTRIKTLTNSTREDNARFFDNDISKVPKLALSVGVGTICDAKEVLLIASGRNKAEAIRQTVEGGVSHMCTASVLQMHKNGVLVCDENAASRLSPHVVEYFQEIVHPGLTDK
jgi:glucosamine-6-phosphate deaminase